MYNDFCTLKKGRGMYIYQFYDCVISLSHIVSLSFVGIYQFWRQGNDRNLLLHQVQSFADDGICDVERSVENSHKGSGVFPHSKHLGFRCVEAPCEECVATLKKRTVRRRPGEGCRKVRFAKFFFILYIHDGINGQLSLGYLFKNKHVI